MNSLLVIEVIIVVILAVGVKLLLVPRFKGWFGEQLVAFCLQKLEPRRYRVLNNIYLPRPDGTTTQIDHVVVSPYGVFVIETKSYKGWIFGDANSKVWTQSIRKKGVRTPIKNTFQNPLYQNYAHLCAIENCTGIPKSVMRPVIAFSGEATFKTRRPDGVCCFAEVLEYIKSFTTPIIKEEQLGEMVTVLQEWQATLSGEQISQHVDNLNRRHAGVSSGDQVPRCPFCGATMVRRTRKADGKSFYGCSTYPKCKGIVNIEGE